MAERGDDGPGGDDAPGGGRLTRRRLLAGATAAGGLGGALLYREATGPGDGDGRPGGDGGADGSGDGGTPGSEDGDDGGAGDGQVIRESVWVETDVDTDDSGTPDRVHVEVARPASTTDGERLPVIMRASPYYGDQTHSDHTPAMRYDREVELSADAEGDAGQGDEGGARTTGGTEGGTDGAVATGTPGATATDASTTAAPRDPIGPTTLERRYVPRGYVVAYASALGTHRSTGCYTAAGPPTLDALASVVDWFNGRATAYDAPAGGDVVAADWTTGTTGMVGTSANGELAIGVATTGVDGLEAVVAQAADASQYSLFRAGGTPISVVPTGNDRVADLGTWLQAGTAGRAGCDHWVERVEAGQDRVTGDYNDFWHAREMLADAGAVDAAVLITHAVDDPIVKPNQFADLYETLDAHGVPVRLWLHEGGHVTPGDPELHDLLDRWWDHWLTGADTGVMDEDPVSIVHGGLTPAEGRLGTYGAWPVPGSKPATVRFEPGGPTAGGLAVDREGADGEQGTDAGDPDPPAESLVDTSRTPAEHLVAASESAHRLRYETPPLAEPVHASGRVVPDLAVAFEEPTVVSAAVVEYGPDGDADVVTRGWADPLNRPAYGEYDSPLAYRQSLRESGPLAAGEQVRVQFPLQATDRIVEAGSRIGVVVYATDLAFTLHPPGLTEVTLSLAESSVAVPVVGGASALAEAFAEEADGARTR